MDKQTLEGCAGTAALALSCVLAGSGDLRTLKLLRGAPAPPGSSASNTNLVSLAESILVGSSVAGDVVIPGVSTSTSRTSGLLFSSHAPAAGLARRLQPTERPTAESLEEPGGVNYGAHASVSMALGFLCLGGGAASFGTSNEAVAALLIALYPRMPSTPQDNRSHLQVRDSSRALSLETPAVLVVQRSATMRLPVNRCGAVIAMIGSDVDCLRLQALRHLYVLAAEPRCLSAVDIELQQSVPLPLVLHLAPSAAHVRACCCAVVQLALVSKSANVCEQGLGMARLQLSASLECT